MWEQVLDMELFASEHPFLFMATMAIVSMVLCLIVAIFVDYHYENSGENK